MELAFVFPGQGSQRVGMLLDLARQFPIVEQTFQEASAVLEYDLWRIVCEGPQEKLDQTIITQPAVLAADVAVYRCWQACTTLTPTVMAGHSLGEYAALVCAGALSFVDAVRLVAKRGLYMQQAVKEGQGAMAAIIGLDEASIEQICEQAAQTEVLAPANFNSIGQTVIAGDVKAVQRAIDKAKAAGAKIAKLIPVSVPSHCPLMQPAADALQKDLMHVSISAPQISVIQNADVASYVDPVKIRDALVRQLVLPVRWVETLQMIAADGALRVLECGPGKVLTGLIKRIDRTLEVSALENPTDFNAAIESISAIREK